MGNMRIGSFNTQDSKVNSHGGMRKDGINNADIVASMVEKFDILGTQELTINFVNALALRLKNYKFYGNYRYGKVLKYLPYNENNQIITKLSIIKNKTIWLPWVAKNIPDLKTQITKLSLMPRVATLAFFDTNDGKKICIINTHLDYQIPSVQVRQLACLKKIISKYHNDYEIILTGDFNLELGDEKFDSFINDVKDDLKHVDIDRKTWHGKNGDETSVDHIFVPPSWEVISSGVIDAKGASDHDAIYADVRIK
ncbi:MAG: endonuclease/exonuclease/phosphatase family protein [Bacilli bacterium]|nr:endonuclease/exonuclease/phosphatase family protein [Bacilli bacterium]